LFEPHLRTFFYAASPFFTAFLQRNQRTKRQTTAAPFESGLDQWIPRLLSRIALISQFIAIYKNMKNARTGGKCCGIAGPPRK